MNTPTPSKEAMAAAAECAAISWEATGHGMPHKPIEAMVAAIDRHFSAMRKELEQFRTNLVVAKEASPFATDPPLLDWRVLSETSDKDDK